MTEPLITRPARTYQVTSLERGLDVLRAVRDADEPMRNREIVMRTGLPKATVSRLVHTLTVLGYLRRIDQGSYVLGQASSKAGRAMLEGLRLERYRVLFSRLMLYPQSQVCLWMHVQGKLMPVYRWSAAGGAALAWDASREPATHELLMAACFNHLCGAAGEPEARVGASEFQRQLRDAGWCHQWHPSAGQSTAGVGVRIGPAALGVLVATLSHANRPAADQLTHIGEALRCAANALACESPVSQDTP